MKKERTDLGRKILVGASAVVAGGIWYQIWSHFQFMSSNLFWLSWLVLVLAITNSKRLIDFFKIGTKRLILVFVLVITVLGGSVSVVALSDSQTLAPTYHVQAAQKWYSYKMSKHFSKAEVKKVYKKFEHAKSGASLAGFLPKLSALCFYFGGAWSNWEKPFSKAYYRGTGLTVSYTYHTQGTAASGKYTNLKYTYK